MNEVKRQALMTRTRKHLNPRRRLFGVICYEFNRALLGSPIFPRQRDADTSLQCPLVTYSIYLAHCCKTRRLANSLVEFWVSLAHSLANKTVRPSTPCYLISPTNSEAHHWLNWGWPYMHVHHRRKNTTQRSQWPHFSLSSSSSARTAATTWTTDKYCIMHNLHSINTMSS